MKRIAIVPARGGSKRIPKKNIKQFFGKPIIGYSIQAAFDSGLFDEIMISTDDEEIAKVVLSFGGSVPFLRSEENSNDYATLGDVIKEVLKYYQEKDVFFDQFCCILPTAPLISSRRIKEALVKLDKFNFDSVTPVVKFSYPIQRALKIEDDLLGMVYPEYLTTRSQDLPPAYHDSGQFYWVRTRAFQNENTFFTKKGSAIELLEKEVQDIDTMEDWELAEWKYKILKNQW